MVPTLLSEGKKWSLHYHYKQFGGKKWESVVGESGGKCDEGIIPIVTRPLTF